MQLNFLLASWSNSRISLVLEFSRNFAILTLVIAEFTAVQNGTDLSAVLLNTCEIPESTGDNVN